MLARSIITAVAGKRLAATLGGGALGAAATAALPFIAKRGFAPLGAALTAAWAARKGYDYYRARKAKQTYPQDDAAVATPA